ncbi:uncharacterized protein LOC143424884 [Xylocopa sonorina]|uniref:uncharacterized protein LOC143424884 n=1 Tax=Xylocopa sonorina TaxID=1818115 RepID=UPI00403A8351
MSIEGKIALVTGGANGIGFCTARKLLRSGAKAVALLDLGDSGGESAAADLNNEFGEKRAIFIVCDVSKSEQLKESFKKIIDTHETLDIVVNIAGIMDDADWEIMVDINYKGIVHGTILGLHTMGKYKGGNGGTIVNMSSVAGLDGIPIAPIYGGTQYAIVGFTQSLKHYYEKTGVRMLTICPGLTTTAMAARFMSTKEHAMDLLDEEMAAKAMVDMQKQPPELVASAIIQLIEKGKNGAILVIENNQPPYEVEIPSYTNLKNMDNIKNKVVVITGGASGLGLKYAEALLRNGAKVVALLDINASVGETSVASLEKQFGKGKAIFILCDAANSQQMTDAFKKVWDTWNAMDIVINNAGIFNDDKWKETIDINVGGLIQGSLLAMKYMDKQKGGKGGTLVNIASIVGFRIYSQVPVYCSSKHNVLAFSRCLEKYADRTGVRVLVMCPGATTTQLFNDHKLLHFLNESDAEELWKILPFQPQEVVQDAMVKLIQKGKNGAIWVVEESKPICSLEISYKLTEVKFYVLCYSSAKISREKWLTTLILDFLSHHVLSQNGNKPANNKRRRSSGSEKAKEIEAINGMVSGRNVLITGGASGLGHAFMTHFLKHGANKIIILDSDAETGRRVEQSVEKTYREKKVHFIHVDVSNYEQMAAAFEKATSLINDINIVINNAGILDERRWEKEIAVNIGGMICTALLAIKYLNRDQLGYGGTLVNVSQHIDIKCTAQLPVYTATKHAIIGLSQSLADTYPYEKTDVRVITLCPGLTETALTVDSPNKLLSRVMKADFVKNLEQVSIQTPYVVAQGLMSILRIGESGSIWVIDNGRTPYEVYVPDPSSLRRTYKNNITLVEPKVTTRGRPIREVCDNTRTGLMSCA